MRAAAGVLLVSNRGRVLLLRRTDGTWGTPGGLAEPEDGTAARTALRELREETGYRPGRPLVLVDESVWPNVLYRTFVLLAGREFRPVLNDEHTAYRWVDPRRPPRGLHRGIGRLLALLG